jgi:general secretion pathway protein I
MSSPDARGFTLLEILVALAILAIAMGAVARASAGNTQHVEAMRVRLLADWVAQNRLALHAARADWLPVGTQSGEETQAGMRLVWREEINGTPNPAFRRIDISVSTADEPQFSLRKLSGFLVAEARR